MLGSVLLLQAGQVTGRLLFFLFSLWYLNRWLGVEAKGAWIGIFSLFGILSVSSNMGFEIWLSRATAAGSVSRKAAFNFLFRVKSGLWAICLLIGGWYVWRGDHHASLAIPFAFALVFDGVGVAQQAVFEGKRDTPAMTLMAFLKSGGFSLVALAVAFLAGHPELPLYGWIFAMVLLARTVYGHRCWRLLPEDGSKVDSSAWRASLLMGAYTMVTVLYFKIDAVMLSTMAGDLETGHYGNAYDFIEGSLFISAAAGAVLYPRLVTGDESSRAHIFDPLFKFILIAAAAMACGLIVFGESVGLLFAGEGFAGAVKPLTILAFGLPFMFGNGLLSRWLFASGDEKLALQTAAIMAVFNIVGNWLLIPQYGASGAAVMTVATEGLLFLMWVLMGRKSWKLLAFWLLLPLIIVAMWYLTKQGYMWGAFVASVVLLGPPLVVYAMRSRDLG